MTKICVGIHVYEQPEGLHATLESLRISTSQKIETVLLPDGPDEATCSALASLGDLKQYGTEDAAGPAACFNRLVLSSDADIFVFLESGAIMGKGWLQHMLSALDSDPSNGLAGPSTNVAWNDQCVSTLTRSGSTNTQAHVDRMAQELAKHYGATIRSLTPLHSLADFCYMVRRDVIKKIGAADEFYGLGPCWEMDYNIRAARAGFLGVWVCSAYVHRAPFIVRRQHSETLLFETNKRLYQDKFCGLRIRGETSDYDPHCKGDDCEHFAPADQIEILRPLWPKTKAASRPLTGTRKASTPLVSCVMPTGNRRDFALQAIRYFQRQDYPERELIIIDDGTDNLVYRLPNDSRVRYVHVTPGLSIGAKRNHGCELARGSIIAQWDDDDWYAPSRLTNQIKPLLEGAADISAVKTGLFFDLLAWKFWSCTPDLHQRLFVKDVHGGTLVFYRHIWENMGPYPNYSLAEDAAFLNQVVGRGGRLCRLDNDGDFIYLRHGKNAWDFQCGEFLDPSGWREEPEPELPPQERAFYLKHKQVEKVPPKAVLDVEMTISSKPLVTCIMPTADRLDFVPHAIRSFLLQDYPRRELVIIDDGTMPSSDLIPDNPRIRYFRYSKKQSIGVKRNLACEEAKGEIIVHWDDDDWHAPWQLTYQVDGLLKASADICGLNRVIFYGPDPDKAWQYVYPSGERPWVYGGALCYTKDIWKKNPFPNLNIAEDCEFVWSDYPKKMVDMDNNSFYVAMIHSGNTSVKCTTDSRWQSYPVKNIQRIMDADWSCFAQLLSRKPA